VSVVIAVSSIDVAFVGHYNYTNLINDLCTLDPELFKNLMFLKVSRA
jgi:hypothetical protein